MENYKKDYTEKVIEARRSLDMFRFKSKREDVPLLADVINILANEDDMTTYRAQSILQDVKDLVPLLSSI